MVIAFRHGVMPPEAVEAVLGNLASTSAGPHIRAGNAGLCHYPARSRS